MDMRSSDTVQPLAIPLPEWLALGQPIPVLDAVVIGSGYGGAVAALRLAQKGWRVTLLERGSEYLPGDFPSDFSLIAKYLRAPSPDGRTVSGRSAGLFEWRAGPGVVSLVANGVGGGSLINAGVLLQPDEDVFAQCAWPAAIRLDRGAPTEPLTHWFDVARGMLDGHLQQATPSLAKTQALQRLARAIDPQADAEAVTATIDPTRCSRCGDCATGCNTPGAKRTLRDTYLARAVQEHGVRLVSRATAYTLQPLPPAAPHDAASVSASSRGARWRVRVLPTERVHAHLNWEDAAAADGWDLDARLVVLAAGTFGSTELLQRSRERVGAAHWWLSPALGSRFSANGDSLTFSTNEPEPVRAIGVGADTWQSSSGHTDAHAGPNDHRIGPTITAVIDLRRPPGTRADGQPQPLHPMEKRLIVEEGAVPGAIRRLFTEGLATQYTLAQLDQGRFAPPRGALWRRGRQRTRPDPLAAGDTLARDPQSAQDALPARTQVLLTMGHDGSRGRIVWVAGRDASVPYWEAPAALTTYTHQDGLLGRAIAKLGGTRLYSPNWKLLPGAASTTMSGPQPEPALTTVHPLGGCAMGDDPMNAVVDDRGRVYASESGQVHEDLFVLDGSIVPTSLGVNPLLTITALAERAMERVGRVDWAPSPATAGAHTAQGPAAPAVPPPQAFVRTDGLQRPRYQVDIRERLACKGLALNGSLRQAAQAHGWSRLDADLRLIFAHGDWLAMWEDPVHPPQLRPGAASTLRMHASSPHPAEGSQQILYELTRGVTHLLAARDDKPLPAWLMRWPGTSGQQVRAALRRVLCSLHDFGHVPRSLLTWLVIRGWSPSSGNWFGELWRRQDNTLARLGAVWGAARSLLRQLRHASERRAMLYDMHFELRDAPPAGSPWPQTLHVVGRKQVDYAASWAEIGTWAAAMLRRRRLPPDQRGPKPLLRLSYLEQVSNLTVTVRDGQRHQALARGRFLMDAHYFFDHQPLQLGLHGDLSQGAMALGAYFGMFTRFALKTRLLDFRLPDYSGRAQPDRSAPHETLLRIGTGTVHPTAHDFTVPRGSSSSEEPGDPTGDLTLRLWRYARPGGARPEAHAGTWNGQPVTRLKSVLLVHAFAQSGYTYTLKSLPTNLAEAFYAAGYEVWILEHRLSTRLPHHREPSTIDPIGAHDWPGAVNFILRTLRREFTQAGEPLIQPQIFAFAQCIGAAALSMALLSGRLAYGRARKDPAAAAEPQCPKLAGAVISQTHPFCIGTKLTQAKTWVPSLLRDSFGRAHIPFAVRNPVTNLVEAWADRFFTAMPIPSEEQCPHVDGAGEDHAATCRRIRYIEAPLFKHRNLLPATHAELPLLFGDANVRLFAHAAKCVQAERLVNEDGFYTYVHDEHLRRYFALPLVFMHGTENELFDLEAAKRSAAQYQRLQPEWAALAGRALHGAQASAHAQHQASALLTIPGHGHLDVLIGREAPTLVFPRVVAAFDHLLAEPHQGLPPADRPDGTAYATARIPRTGPFIGRLRPRGTGATTGLGLRLSFQIDDRFSDGKQGPYGTPGCRTWAVAHVTQGAHDLGWHLLPVHDFDVPSGGITHDAACATPTPNGRFRFAAGELQLAGPLSAALPLDIEAFSLHETLVVQPSPEGCVIHVPDPSGCVPAAPVPSDVLPLPAGWETQLARHPLPQPTTQGLSEDAGRVADHAVALPGALAPWLAQLIACRVERLEGLLALDAPVPETVSRFKLQAEAPQWRQASVPATALQAVLPEAATGQARTAQSLCFLATSCRYPGFGFDEERVDQALRPWITAEPHTARQAATAPDLPPAAYALLLGDQIYADATAGLADPHSPTERFIERHLQAFRRAHPQRGEAPRLGDLVASLPVYMTPDDHEYIDNYPNGSPLVRTHPGTVPPRALLASRVAGLAQHAFQQLPAHGHPERAAYAFSAGPVRTLVVDTRSHRPCVAHPAPPGSLLSARTKRIIRRWLAQPAAEQQLNVLATGSVVLPALFPRADPANPGEPDDASWCPADRQWLLDTLAEAAHRRPALRFLLISGDYHVSTMLRVALADRTVGAAIVVPPLYAPMPYMDASPGSLWLAEPVTTPAGPLTLHSAAADGVPGWSGSGVALVSVERAGAGYRVGLRSRLVQWAAHRAPAQIQVDILL